MESELFTTQNATDDAVGDSPAARAIVKKHGRSFEDGQNEAAYSYVILQFFMSSASKAESHPCQIRNYIDSIEDLPENILYSILTFTDGMWHHHCLSNFASDIK